jgi:hypothetical protein
VVPALVAAIALLAKDSHKHLADHSGSYQG